MAYSSWEAVSHVPGTEPIGPHTTFEHLPAYAQQAIVQAIDYGVQRQHVDPAWTAEQLMLSIHRVGAYWEIRARWAA